jgi:hypothetical protein
VLPAAQVGIGQLLSLVLRIHETHGVAFPTVAHTAASTVRQVGAGGGGHWGVGFYVRQVGHGGGQQPWCQQALGRTPAPLRRQAVALIFDHAMLPVDPMEATLHVRHAGSKPQVCACKVQQQLCPSSRSFLSDRFVGQS